MSPESLETYGKKTLTIIFVIQQICRDLSVNDGICEANLVNSSNKFLFNHCNNSVWYKDNKLLQQIQFFQKITDEAF